MAFRVLNQSPVYLDLAGAICAGGSLTFYTTGTTTAKNVYGDPALTVNNGNVITLDASGRPNVDIWGSGAYSVVLKNSIGTSIWTKDNVQDLSVTFPVGTNGQILSTDGATPANLSFITVRAVPDPTGAAGKVLTTDGTVWSWGTVNLSAGGGATMSGWVTSNMRELRQTVVAAATTNLDYALGGVVVLTQAVDITTLTFTNLPAAGQTAIFTIRRVKDATGTSRAWTWPVAIKWPGGVAPTLTQTTGGRDVFSLLTEDGGVTWDGSYNTAMA